MPITLEHINKMKTPVLCELCNKTYTLGVMKKHKQTKMHIENAEKWWFMGGTKPNAFVGGYNKPIHTPLVCPETIPDIYPYLTSHKYISFITYLQNAHSIL
jgi:hypothetical protein